MAVVALDVTMRRSKVGKRSWTVMVVLMALTVPGLMAGDAGAEDVEMSTTFLTFFKTGGGYIEYRINGGAAADLRAAIDDPQTKFPFETTPGDGDGMVDQFEGEQYIIAFVRGVTAALVASTSHL